MVIVLGEILFLRGCIEIIQHSCRANCPNGVFLGGNNALKLATKTNCHHCPLHTRNIMNLFFFFSYYVHKRRGGHRWTMVTVRFPPVPCVPVQSARSWPQ